MNLSQFGREFALVAACCRWPLAPPALAAIAAAAHQIDWAAFLKVVRRQRVQGLVNNALLHADVAAPEAVLKELRAEASQIARQNLTFAAESVRLQRLMTSADIPLLFVKGITLAMLAYGSLSLKMGWDIDILVLPEDAGKAATLLRDAGYQRLIPGPELSEEQFGVWVRHWKESVWRHEAKGIHVELHTALVDNPALLPGIGARSPAQLVQVSPGIELPTLKKDELFSYLCVHGASSAWSRIKWIADLAALIQNDDPNEINRLYRRSLQLGCGRASALALLLSSEIMGVRLLPALEAELRGSWMNRYLLRIACAMMAGRHVATELDETRFATFPIHLMQLFLMKGWRYKAAELWRQSVDPHDRSTVSLARPLQFLYPFLLVRRYLSRSRTAP